MDEMMGIILTEESENQLGTLTEKRAISALPVAGRYRLIDFVLSNMVNSGIVNVGVATQYNYSSLMDHLGSGKPWDLNRKNYGLFILPPHIGHEYAAKADGDVDVLYGVGGFLRKSAQKYVLLAEGHTIYNMTFGDALEFHKDRHADVTIIYNDEKDLKRDQLSHYTLLDVDENGTVTDLMKSHPHPTTTNVSMDTYILEKSLLVSLVDNCVAHGEHDWVMDALIKNRDRLKICGYRFDGHVGRVDSVQSYYENNLNFLNSNVRGELFGSENKIYTKVKDQIPARYGMSADVRDSLVADGCFIDGHVENSIIFRGVHIARGAVVKNSVIMQNSSIGQDCTVENAVLDKEVTLRNGKTVMGQPNYPFIIAKGATV